MHKEFAKEGLVCMSLSVDEEENEKQALEFLQKSGAAFPNYILVDTDDNKDKLDRTLAHRAVPIVYVFDRAGKKVKTYDRAIHGDELDMLVKELLMK